MSAPGISGHFEDDYGIRYNITSNTFFQGPNAKYHILKWDTAAKLILLKNDEKNISDKGLYTRIDYVFLKDMQPYSWAFCYTIYNAKNAQDAVKHPVADTAHLRTGCNGYPFSRLKSVAP